MPDLVLREFVLLEDFPDMRVLRKSTHKNSPVAALLTDFGLRDQYVGAMKGVMLSICPELRIVDLTHTISPQNVRQGAYLLWAAYRYLPSDCIFVCVVDPGVGSRRNILIARSGRRLFVAPDNGLLDSVLWQEKVKEVILFDRNTPKARAILPPSISTTFHGRDIFAPIGAHLAMGVNPLTLGQLKPLTRLRSPFVGGRNPEGKPQVLHIDSFGNIITNIAGSGPDRRKDVGGICIGRTIVKEWIKNYDAAALNNPCLIVGSSGLIEIVVKNGSAAAQLRADECSPLKIITQKHRN